MIISIGRVAGALRIFGPVVLVLAMAGIAYAHAYPDHAEPKVGSEVTVAPKEVKIWFTDDIKPLTSRIQVFDGAGNQVDKRDSHVNSKDSSELIVSLEALEPGIYKVVWNAECVCGHVTDGSFKFAVKEAK
jgi:methionine-rich copper-binding protein CopC